MGRKESNQTNKTKQLKFQLSWAELSMKKFYNLGAVLGNFLYQKTY